MELLGDNLGVGVSAGTGTHGAAVGEAELNALATFSTTGRGSVSELGYKVVTAEETDGIDGLA